MVVDEGKVRVESVRPHGAFLPKDIGPGRRHALTNISGSADIKQLLEAVSLFTTANRVHQRLATAFQPVLMLLSSVLTRRTKQFVARYCLTVIIIYSFADWCWAPTRYTYQACLAPVLNANMLWYLDTEVSCTLGLCNDCTALPV